MKKIKNCIIVVLLLALLLPNTLFLISLAESSEIITITTGQEFVSKVVSSNFGKEFIISGTEVLSDGTYGIILPEDYTSVDGFFGTLTGVDNKNNIEMSSKSLFLTLGSGETVIDNLILKGYEMSPTGNSKHFGVLVSSVTETLANVTIKNIINYVDVKSEFKRLGLGGVIGFVKNTGVTLEGCINFGDLTCSNDTISCGGILGGANNAGIVKIVRCVNYGNLIGDKDSVYMGGIYGRTFEYNQTAVPSESFSISQCANYGNITGSASTLVYSGGIAAQVYKATISECFNVGQIISGARYAAGILAICISTNTNDTLVADCFNLGTIMGANSSTSLKLSESPAGIANAVNAGNRDSVMIERSYNMGIMNESAPNFTQTLYYNMITNSKSTLCSDNYQTTESTKGNYLDPESLKTELPDNYSTDIWEYISVDNVDDEYTYPQLKNNIYWNDYKYFGTNDATSLASSLQSGEITGLDSDWEMVDNAKDNTSTYISLPSGYGISTLASYKGILGLPMVRTDMTSAASLCSFSINKSAQIFIATDINPETTSLDALTNGGFMQVFNADNSPATIVTKGGKIFYLSAKSVIVEENETSLINIDSIDELGIPYFLFINWIDNGIVDLDLSGNEKIYINDELVTGSTVLVGKGAPVEIKIEPNEGYYIKDFLVDGESEQQNITSSFEKTFTVDGNIAIKCESALYEFIDDNSEDDITYPFYTLVQEIDNSTETVVQSIKAEGYLGEFLEGATVTLKIKQSGIMIASDEDIVDEYGKVQLIGLVGTNEGDCTIEFTVNVSGKTSNISIDESKKTFKIPSVADVNTLISNLNNSQITAGELTALILEERDTLAFKTSVFKKLNPTIQMRIASDIILNTDYNVTNLYTRFDNFVIMNTFNLSENSEDIIRVLDDYAAETLIDTSELYDDYLIADNKSEVCSGMLGITYSDASFIMPQFEYSFVKNKLSKVESYDKILTELDKFDAILGIESKVATALSKNINEVKVINEGIGKSLPTLTTKELFIEKLDYLILNASQIVADNTNPVLPPPIPSGNVGGGGGGGRGNISVSNDYVEYPEIKQIEQNADNAFTDLNNVSWAYDSIRSLFYKGIVKGKETGKFCPNDKVTRAEFVKMVVDAFDLEVENPECTFSDISKDHWAYKYVASASSEGWISGYSATVFGTEGNITRQDMVTILIRIIYRLSKYEAMENRKDVGTAFADEEEIANYALVGVKMFKHAGIIAGYEDGTFRPTNDLTRAEAAVILNRVLEFFRI